MAAVLRAMSMSCIQNTNKHALQKKNITHFMKAVHRKCLFFSSALSNDTGDGQFYIHRWITVRAAVVLYGCATWSVILREEHRLRVLENRVVRRIFGAKRDEVTEKWRKLHEELNDLYSSPNIIRVIKSRRMRWAWQVARRREGRGRSDGKRPLGRPRNKWKNNIKMDLMVWDWGMD